MIPIRINVTGNLVASTITPEEFWAGIKGDMLTAVQPFYQQVLGSTKSKDVKSKYFLSANSDSRHAEVSLSNLSSGWLWEEITTPPHWPPKKAGSRLDLWADNAYAAAWHVSVYGTTGTYAFKTAIDAHKDRMILDVMSKTLPSMMDYLFGKGSR